ncbi:endonuclease/exonuclease/phosphatase family protein [Polaribacter sp. Z014]|uniref:endonuclease/exonuclease/phosphatase family protein n=1 Tax=Polaribacter sp. Z014 TaxID=2927126 RepID=UPI0020200CD1|nr:endonuclease/exonuclease/phosphatase family protein [Polaribacter sp. Z014]MCL7764752.1 endonuclease/exonuclease/phosphatase family protein [Polaribacter sp. Z014]
MRNNLFLCLIILFYSFTNPYNSDKENNKNKDTAVERNSEKKTTLKILTWNIQNLGRTKNNEELNFIANTIKNYDVIAIQEVVAKDPKGTQAVAKIVSALNRLGNKWNYTISNPTKSPSSYISERYAYIWKTSKLRLVKKATLDVSLENIIEREPYLAKFEIKKSNTTFYFINIHARIYNKHPEMEIAHFKKYPKKLETDHLFILGDFNLNEKHNVWNPLYKMGFKPAIKNTATTLKKKCKNGNYTNHAIDNIYYNANKVNAVNTGVVDFVDNCNNLINARMISDHLPVFLEFNI